MLDKQVVLQVEAATENIAACSLVINIFPFFFLNIFSTWKPSNIEAQHLAICCGTCLMFVYMLFSSEATAFLPAERIFPHLTH